MAKSETPPQASRPQVDDDVFSYRSEFPKAALPAARSDIANLAGYDDDFTTVYERDHADVAAPEAGETLVAAPEAGETSAEEPEVVTTLVAIVAAPSVAGKNSAPQDRWWDSEAIVALSRKVRFAAKHLRSVSIVYPLSVVALTLSGTALYLAETTPSRSGSVAVIAPSTSDDPTVWQDPASPSAAAASDAPPPSNTLDEPRSPTASPSAGPPAQRRKATAKPAAQQQHE